ncbi:hypothetical protein GGD66_006437 [Bradyrhizobium sp. CIR48]|nr:hypothetical protein [Bradyrhizobium sp. CIR48]
MAESFGNEFTVVEVTPDSGSRTEIWLALAKPSQAVTLVLAAVPEGWTAQVVPAVLSEKQLKTFGEVNLKPGEVRRLSSE